MITVSHTIMMAVKDSIYLLILFFVGHKLSTRNYVESTYSMYYTYYIPTVCILRRVVFDRQEGNDRLVLRYGTVNTVVGYRTVDNMVGYRSRLMFVSGRTFQFDRYFC